MKKEPLEIQDLAIYLPHGIECLVTKPSYLKYPEEERTGMLTSIEIDSNVENICITKASGKYFLTEVEHVLPFLKPLTELSNEQLKEFYNDADIDIIRMNYAIIINYRLMGETFKEVISLRALMDEKHSNLTMGSWLFIKLVENQFDVFGLIEKGQAIDHKNLNSQFSNLTSN